MKPQTSPHRKQVSSFIKWAGGKGRLLEQYHAFLPHTLRGRHYVEPFMGSAALFFHVVQNLQPLSCTLLDVNPELVNTFQQVRDAVEPVISLLTEHRAHHNRESSGEEQRRQYYYGVRLQNTGALSPAERAARFIYLNKTCFNGLHRLNSRGEFNVPMGRYTLPAIFDADHLRAVSELLRSVRIELCEFRSCATYIGPGDFVYFDPPYEPLSATSSFTAYARGAFSADDQRALRDLMRNLAAECDCMASNSTAPLIESLYADAPFHKHYVMAGRSVNSVAQGRGKIRELVITTYPVSPLP